MVRQAIGSQRPRPVGGGDDADAAVRRQQDLLTEDRQPERPLRRDLADGDDRLDDDHRHERDYESLDVVDLVDDVDPDRRDQHEGERLPGGRTRIDRDRDAQPGDGQQSGHGECHEQRSDADPSW